MCIDIWALDDGGLQLGCLWTGWIRFWRRCDFFSAIHAGPQFRHHQTELLDSFNKTASRQNDDVEGISDQIGIHNSEFIWTEKNESTAEDPVPFTVRIDGTVRFIPGATNLITGAKWEFFLGRLGGSYRVQGRLRLARPHCSWRCWANSTTCHPTLRAGRHYLARMVSHSVLKKVGLRVQLSRHTPPY